MSYCRWSSMNSMCDVYVYEDVAGGWTTHVASNRAVIPPIPMIDPCHMPGFGGKWDKHGGRMRYPSKAHQFLHRLAMRPVQLSMWLHSLSLRIIPRRNIGFEHDGETFNDISPGACANRLRYLREMGYRVPEHAINALVYEQRMRDLEVA